MGYGDYSPVTPVGRTIAVGLMFGGIALLGVVTATLASWLLERIADRDGAGEDRAGPGEPGPRADPPGGSSVSSGP